MDERLLVEHRVQRLGRKEEREGLLLRVKKGPRRRDVEEC